MREKGGRGGGRGRGRTTDCPENIKKLNKLKSVNKICKHKHTIYYIYIYIYRLFIVSTPTNTFVCGTSTS